MKSSTVRQYRLRLPKTTWERATMARAEAARLWSRMVKLHAWFRKRNLPWPSCSDFERHYKGRFALHSQTIQAIVQKFLAHVAGVRTHHQNGNSEARYPHRLRTFVNVVWKGQCLQIRGSHLTLPMGRGRSPLSLRLPAIPDGKIVQAELAFGRLLLTVSREINDPVPGDKVAAADLGLIHLAVVTDGEKSLSVLGRGLRSIKQGQAKALASMAMQQSRCQKGSRRWRKLQAAKRKRSTRVRDQARNALHHAANAVIGFCTAQGAGTLVVGNVTEMNRGKKGRTARPLNQELGLLELGTLVRYLKYKGERQGIALKTESEIYTTQTCPACGIRNKTSGRRYVCQCCGYTGVRDEVGAVNLLNRYLNGNIVPNTLVPKGNIRYLRPVVLKRPRSVVAPLTPATLLAWPRRRFLPSREGSVAVASSRIPRF